VHEGLTQLAAGYWALEVERSPTTGLLVGDYSHADRMEDLSRSTEDDTITRLRSFADAAEAIDPYELEADERTTRAVLIEEARASADELSSRLAEFAVDHVSGFHVTFLQLASQLAAPTPDVADALVTKWSRVGDTFDGAVRRLRQGVAKGRTPPVESIERTITQIGDYLASSLDDDPFIHPTAPPDFDAAAEAAWREALREQVTDVIRPAYAAYRDALRHEILEKGRPQERSGLLWLPDGEAVYARTVRRHTSLDLAPLDVHRSGLAEVDELADEYRILGTQVLSTEHVEEIFERLRNDPALRFSDSAEIVAAAQAAMDRAGDAISDWFGRLPVTECVMAEIPGAGAEDAPLAFYLPPATDGSRPGTYFVNTTEATTRTRYESEALAFHESLPGHHLQLAIAQELDGVPEFRKHALVNVYVEGWALYAERLADEMGLYSDDVARLGILSFDSWRAGRLVVDTGIHALGWSRQEAIDWMAANSPQALNNVANEIDRYIGWPGQALSYKIGQRELLRLRADAQAAMGDRFDIRGFHDVVLGSGPVPIPVLQELVTTWAAT
jgi:uncharacterized protein (DUF885 family)